MSEITLHTGCMGDEFVVNIDWHNHNNCTRNDKLEINILNLDKPRTLQILLNGCGIGEIVNDE